MVEPRWEVKIGSIVRVTEGDYGHLQQLLVDPQRERVIGLLVRPHELVPSHPVIVPEKAIADSSENEVRLKISRKQVEALPRFQPGAELVVEDQSYQAYDALFAVRGKHGVEVRWSPGSWEHGMFVDQLTGPDGKNFGLLLQAGQQVFCGDRHAGHVSLILLDPIGQIRGLIVHVGHPHPFGRELIVPAAWIQGVDRENVHLAVEERDLEGLPDYCTDEVLGEVVDHALWSNEILRNTDYKEIGISVEHGVVRLRGHVITHMNKRNAEEAVHSVSGVLGLENYLVVDQDLLIDVAQALGKNDLTRSERISVGVQNGFVTLNGQVGSSAVRVAAEAVAASIPQVRGVVNDLQAPNVVLDNKESQTWQPHIGQQACAADMQLGRVERVIINPRNRRVTAFVVRGYFPDPKHKDNYRLPDEDPEQERSVVIPIVAVRYETDSAVLLEVNGTEAAKYPAFDPAGFKNPPAEWQPPYPYRWEQVSFDAQSSEEPRSKLGSTEKTSKD